MCRGQSHGGGTRAHVWLCCFVCAHVCWSWLPRGLCLCGFRSVIFHCTVIFHCATAPEVIVRSLRDVLEWVRQHGRECCSWRRRWANVAKRPPLVSSFVPSMSAWTVFTHHIPPTLVCIASLTSLSARTAPPPPPPPPPPRPHKDTSSVRRHSRTLRVVCCTTRPHTPMDTSPPTN